eukprot:TRINITY_DN2426_c0_g1_i4.p1 TRINITY_DN2426_c0_g1~~TRINITY_DN2426_c0_g1_i4.p1  ORF type:complete len:199 (-),score=16.08 TRINITY_DN2426_c0_g1_i4:19-615(-)
MVWYGVVWCGMVWYGVVWCGMVWYGVVWCGMSREHTDHHVVAYPPSRFLSDNYTSAKKDNTTAYYPTLFGVPFLLNAVFARWTVGSFLVHGLPGLLLLLFADHLHEGGGGFGNFALCIIITTKATGDTTMQWLISWWIGFVLVLFSTGNTTHLMASRAKCARHQTMSMCPIKSTQTPSSAKCARNLPIPHCTITFLNE